MANGYFALPAPRIENALVNFAPVNNALANVSQQANADRNYAMHREQVSYQRGRDARNDELMRVKRGGDMANAIMQMPDTDPAKPQAWSRYLKEYGDGDHSPEELDFRTGPKIAAAQAGRFLDPQAQELKRLQIEAARSNLATGALQRQRMQQEMDSGGKPRIMEVDGSLVRVMPDGTATEVYKGQPNLTKKPLTEHESKDALFAERMLRAERDLDGVIPIDEGGHFTKYNPTTWRQNYAPDRPALSNLWTANLMNSKEWQQYQRAARESLSAILRKDTGAAVTDEEFNTYFPTYFPIPGDSPEVVKQKKVARDQIGMGLRGASGRAFDIMFPPTQQPQAPSSQFKYLGTVP